MPFKGPPAPVRESQPWSFRIVAGDRIELRADPARWLKVGDPRARGLTISCGAALFNLRMALRGDGPQRGGVAASRCGPRPVSALSRRSRS